MQVLAIKNAAFSFSHQWRRRSSSTHLLPSLKSEGKEKKKEVAGCKKKKKKRKEALALWAPFAAGAACKAGAGPPKTQDTVSRGFVIADVSLCQL